ncbi:MAG: secretion protein HlyD [Caulobacteraceae bacterium]|nr:secretion protein HlyD [Caulobacteraceae bacterium]
MSLSNPTVLRDRAAPAPAKEKTRPAASPSAHARKAAILAGAALVLGAAAFYGHRYWTEGRFEVATDDAYVKADSTVVAPKVSGYIQTVAVQDNQPVKAGALLARIDDRDLRTALDEAHAAAGAARASVANLDAQLVAQNSEIGQAASDVSASEAALALARSNNTRFQTMAKVGYGSNQQAEQAAADLQQKLAGAQHQGAALAHTRQQVGVLTAQRALAAAQLQRAEAAERQAQLNLGYATVTAPIDGVVGARSLRVGQYVQAGAQLMAVVPVTQAYVVANYKETQLTRLRPGQAATVKVDSFPGQPLHGRVDSVAPATGLEFSLLPPDNATGNFTKVVQRIAVKIVIDDADGLAYRLRPGMSVETRVEARDGRK